MQSSIFEEEFGEGGEGVCVKRHRKNNATMKDCNRLDHKRKKVYKKTTIPGK